MNSDAAQPDEMQPSPDPLAAGEGRLPELEPILVKLPWYGDLVPDHRGEMLNEVELMMTAGTTRDVYEKLLRRWAEVAHVDLKRAKFELLRASGILNA